MSYKLFQKLTSLFYSPLTNGDQGGYDHIKLVFGSAFIRNYLGE